MACCEVLFGTVPPTAPPSEAQIPLYIDRTSKKVYYWNGTGWELVWELKTAGVGTPGVVSIDPNSPIYVGEGGTLQINCERLKTQCGFATVQEVSEAVSSAINELVKSLNTTLQEMNSRITSLSNTVSQFDSGLTQLEGRVSQVDTALGSLAGRVSSIEAWDLCAKTSSCGYSTGGGSPATGVTKLIAGTNITLSPASGTGEVTINAAGGSGGSVVTPPPPPGPNGGVMDYGGWRIMMGQGNTVTGYLDPINFVAQFDGVFAISITEGNAVGWGAPGAGNHIPEGPTVFGWTRHPTDPNNKFLLSVARRNWDGDFVYAAGVTFSYIAYGKKPG